jgi:hypothetical protein
MSSFWGTKCDLFYRWLFAKIVFFAPIFFSAKIIIFCHRHLRKVFQLKKNLSLSGHDLNNGNKFLKFFQSIHCQVLFNSLVDSVMKPGIFSNNS